MVCLQTLQSILKAHCLCIECTKMPFSGGYVDVRCSYCRWYTDVMPWLEVLYILRIIMNGNLFSVKYGIVPMVNPVSNVDVD